MLSKTSSLIAGAAFALLAARAQAQTIGAYDNFDCFNDTGQEAEGFEIDVEDVGPLDLIREFPSNFSQPGLIRYGLPKSIKAYDWTKATADAAHSYDQGHKGVLITWEATWDSVHRKYVATYGTYATAAGPEGNGTPYVKNPAYTNGDSCWLLGLGKAYPSSGCDHFGISFTPTARPGKTTYHWKIDQGYLSYKVNSGVLVNAQLEAPIPPSPTLAMVPPAVPGNPPVVQAAAPAPINNNQDPAQVQELNPQYGDAYWVKKTTLFTPKPAAGVQHLNVLDNLQKADVQKANVTKTVVWHLLQRPPLNNPANGLVREADDQDQVAGNNVVVVKQYEYFKFTGAYDSETHQALCDNFYKSQADATAAANGVGSPTPVQISCQNAVGDDYPYGGTYWTIDPGPNVAVGPIKGDLGQYVGAHVNGYEVK